MKQTLKNNYRRRLAGCWATGLVLDWGSSRDQDQMWMDPGVNLGAGTWIPAIFVHSGSSFGVSRWIPAEFTTPGTQCNTFQPTLPQDCLKRH